MTTAANAHASPPGPAVDVAAVLAGDGQDGYGRSLGVALDALVNDGVLGSAAAAPPPAGAARTDVLRLLAAGSTMAVVVQGAGNGRALAEVAAAMPEEAFIWIPGEPPTDPITAPAGLPNVATIYADVSPAATLLGELLAEGSLLAEAQRLGWTGASEPFGDDGIFITSLIGASGLNAGSVVLTSRLTDTPPDSLPPFDVLLVSGLTPSVLEAPLRIEIAGSLGGDESDAPDAADGARRIVVGFHYNVALAEIIAGYEAGVLGGTEHHLTLENGGLTLDATDPDDADVLHEALVDAGFVEAADSAPPDTTESEERAPDETEPPSTSPPVAPTFPAPGTTSSTVPGTSPPDRGAPDTTQPTEPTTVPTTNSPGTTAGDTSSTAPPTTPTVPTIPPPPTEPPPSPTVPLPTDP